MAQSIDITATDGSGSFQAYIAMPKRGLETEHETGPTPRVFPAVLAIQEVFGVNANMRGICDELAAQGYIALCPDMFWRTEPGLDLSDKIPAELGRALQLFQSFDFAKGMEDLAATILAARALPACSGKVGAIGYCLGGLLAYKVSTDLSIDAAVSYYGVGIDQKLDDADGITSPLILHMAAEDQFVNKNQQVAINEKLSGHTQVTLHSYAGQEHAFARSDSMHWNAEAAALANDRTKEFFERHLKG